MRNPWTVLRCRFLGHGWETIEVDGPVGWRCRCCDELVLEREYLERVHDPEVTDRSPASHGGAAAGLTPPFG
jgi:hypothetical protein